MDFALMGKMIAKYRKKLGYTQQAFSEILDLSPNYLGAIERGVQIPKLETFIQIANALGVTADELLLGVISQARGLQASVLSEQIKELQDHQISMILNVVEQMLTDFKKWNT